MSLQQAVKAILATAVKPCKTNILQNYIRIAPGEVRGQHAVVIAVSTFTMDGPGFEPFLLSLEYAKELAKITEPIDIILFDPRRRQASFGFVSGREATYGAELDEMSLLRHDALFDAEHAPAEDGKALMNPETISSLSRRNLSRGKHEAHLPLRMTLRAVPRPALIEFSDHFKALVMPVVEQQAA